MKYCSKDLYISCGSGYRTPVNYRAIDLLSESRSGTLIIIKKIKVVQVHKVNRPLFLFISTELIPLISILHVQNCGNLQHSCESLAEYGEKQSHCPEKT